MKTRSIAVVNGGTLVMCRAESPAEYLILPCCSFCSGVCSGGDGVTRFVSNLTGKCICGPCLVLSRQVADEALA